MPVSLVYKEDYSEAAVPEGTDRLNKNITILLVILLFAGALPKPVFAQDNRFLLGSGDSRTSSPWLQEDKVKHFAVSAGLAFGSFYVYRAELNNTETGSYYFSGGFAISIGALKEYYDSKHPQTHHADWRDFAADAAGVGFGLILAYMTIN